MKNLIKNTDKTARISFVNIVKSLLLHSNPGNTKSEDEQWKYTSGKHFDAKGYELTSGHGSLDLVSTSSVQASEDDLNIVFVNGALSDSLSQISGLPEGLTIESLPKSLDDKEIEELLSNNREFDNAFDAQNEAILNHGVTIKVAPNTVVEQNIHIMFLHQCDNKAPVFSSPKKLLSFAVNVVN